MSDSNCGLLLLGFLAAALGMVKLVERSGRKSPPTSVLSRPVRRYHTRSGDPNHVPGEGEPFYVDTGGTRGEYVSQAAKEELNEKIAALGMVPGSREWEEYKERKDAERYL